MMPSGTEYWDLRLYVAGHTDKSLRAINNLKRICEEHLEGRYTIEVIDLVERAAACNRRSDNCPADPGAPSS